MLKELYEIETEVELPPDDDDNDDGAGGAGGGAAGTGESSGSLPQTSPPQSAAGQQQPGSRDAAASRQRSNRPTSKASAKSSGSESAAAEEESGMQVLFTKRFPELEVVFVSSDRSKDQMAANLKQHGRWLAVPYNDKAGAKARLAERYAVKGLPTLVAVDSQTGTVLSRDGRAEVLATANKPGDPYDVGAFAAVFESWHAARGS